MKSYHKAQTKIIAINMVICLALILGLVIHSYNNFNFGIAIITLLLIMNGLSFISSIKMKSHIDKVESRLELLEEVLESAPNAVFVHRKLKFTYLNKKAAELFGIENPENIIGKPVEDYVKINLKAVGKERYEACLEGRPFKPMVEKMFFKANGQIIDMEIYDSSIEVNNECYALVICRNVTEQKKIAELKEKINEDERKLREKIEQDKMKDEFFANLSHELRTPLTIILGILQLLEKSNDKIAPVEDERFQMLKHNGYRLLRLVNNLLDITKIDSGYFEMTKKKYNIVTVVEDITASVIDYVDNKDLNIVFDTEVEEKIVSCHVDSIDRIILNLIANAVKFTPNGGSIFVNIYDEAEKVKIIIKDTGIGIKEEDLPYIFERFRQVDKSFTRNHEGSGIGLSIVKALVELQGGTIEVRSEYGKGSEFIIRLPVEEVSVVDMVCATVEGGIGRKQKISIEFSDL